MCQQEYTANVLVVDSIVRQTEELLAAFYAAADDDDDAQYGEIGGGGNEVDCVSSRWSYFGERRRGTYGVSLPALSTVTSHSFSGRSFLSRKYAYA